MDGKNNKFQVLVWLLCIVLVVSLIYMVKIDRKRRAERNIQLQQQAQQIEKESEEITEQQSEIYDKFYSELDLPEIICWGDNLMTGENGGSFSDSFNKILEKNLFKNLTNTFHNVLDDEKHVIPALSIVNMGVVNEDMRQILARAGVNKVYLGENIDLLSSKDPVSVMLVDEETFNRDEGSRELLFADQKSDKFGMVSISDIQGRLKKTEEWIDPVHPRYAFVRNQEGDSEWLNAGTQVQIETASKYVGDIPVFFFENLSEYSVDSFIVDLRKLVRRYTCIDGNGDVEENDTSHKQMTIEDDTYDLPFVLICRISEGSDLDSALKNEFGDRYLRIDYYSREMAQSSFSSLSQNIYDMLDQQGCFSDIKEQIQKAVDEVNDL